MARPDRTHRVRPDRLRFAKALRREMAPAECVLWNRLRGGRLNGLKFRRQVSIGRFIADFVCLEHRLVIELDGPSHGGREMKDDARTVELCAAGYRVLRFLNQEVFRDVDDVLERIRRECVS